jgi:hypothetical protein
MKHLLATSTESNIYNNSRSSNNNNNQLQRVIITLLFK